MPAFPDFAKPPRSRSVCKQRSIGRSELVNSAMPRFKLRIEYAGTRYSGWQIQKNARTVQGEIDRAVVEATGERTFELYGAGRTDAGVHALGQVAHLDVHTGLPPESLRRPDERGCCRPTSTCSPSTRRSIAFTRDMMPWPALTCSNRAAPDGVREALRVVGEGIARSSERCGRRPPPSPAERTSGIHRRRSRRKINRRRDRARRGGGRGRRDPRARRRLAFLWKMVRRMVGVLVEVGRGELEPADVPRLLRAPSGIPAKLTAPPSGLFLARVTYPGDRVRVPSRAHR